MGRYELNDLVNGTDYTATPYVELELSSSGSYANLVVDNLDYLFEGNTQASTTDDDVYYSDDAIDKNSTYAYINNPPQRTTTGIMAWGFQELIIPSVPLG